MYLSCFHICSILRISVLPVSKVRFTFIGGPVDEILHPATSAVHVDRDGPISNDAAHSHIRLVSPVLDVAVRYVISIDFSSISDAVAADDDAARLV